MRFTLAMIIKGTPEEAALLDRALTSVKGVFDEKIIVVTHQKGEKPCKEVHKVAKKHSAFSYDFEWVDDFSAARSFSFQKATGEIIFWMDADDTVDKPSKLRRLAEQMPDHVDAIFLEYYYEIDEYGSLKTTHWRERIIRNNGAYTWKGRLHETLIENRRTTKIKNDEVKIVHHSDNERRDGALERNIRILQQQLEDEGRNPDPRTLFYLAACYKDAAHYTDALGLYELYVTMSGWDEERAQAYCQIASIKRLQDKRAEAVDAYLKAVAEDPTSREGYTGLAEMYLLMERYDRAKHWAELALAQKQKDTMTIMNPLSVTYRPLLVYAEACFNLGEVSEAIAAVKSAQEIRNDDLTKEMLKLFMDVQGHKLAAESFADLARFLEKEGDEQGALRLLDAVPRSLADNPIVLAQRKKLVPPKKWPEKSAVIFTGASVLGSWTPDILKQTGVGGSEEAIIRLSRQLVGQGYSVTVYAEPGAFAGDYDGVTWKNYWEMDMRDTFDVFIAWRSPWLFDAKIKARKKYLWLHDVMELGEFTPQRLDNLDKVIVLSQYHREIFPNIPDDKIFISANGIDPEEFSGSERTVRNPHRIIYTSSHTRGLSRLYDIWPAIKAEIPDAILDVYYGRESFDAINRDNPERMAWMDKMISRARTLDGVTDHGRVPQDQIARETMASGVWAYPTSFPEISCISGMKAQAGGAVPVTSNFAALDETVQHGVKLEISEDWTKEDAAKYQEALIDMLKDDRKQAEIRSKMIPWAKQTYDWKNVAKGWIKEFEK